MNKKELVKELATGVLDGRMYHGIAVCKKYIVGTSIVIGQAGIITAYLPDMEKFAVNFGKDIWITFSETEEKFLETFDVELDKEK